MPAQALCRFKVGTLNVCTMKCSIQLEVLGETWVFVSNLENTTYSLMAGLEMIERASISEDLHGIWIQLTTR